MSNWIYLDQQKKAINLDHFESVYVSKSEGPPTGGGGKMRPHLVFSKGAQARLNGENIYVSYDTFEEAEKILHELLRRMKERGLTLG